MKTGQVRWVVIAILIAVIIGLMFYPQIMKNVLTSGASAVKGLADQAQHLVK
jgi:hypothetical protein